MARGSDDGSEKERHSPKSVLTVEPRLVWYVAHVEGPLLSLPRGFGRQPDPGAFSSSPAEDHCALALCFLA